MQRDVQDDETMILWIYSEYLKEKEPKKKQRLYHVFRQGLDIQDLNPVIYEMLGRNQNSIENWFPQLFSQGANDFSHLGEWRVFMHF